MNNLPPPSAFTIDQNDPNKWSKWRKKFENYIIASDLDSKTIQQQRAILLHIIGDSALEIYNTFGFEETAQSPTIKDILDKYDQYFRPFKNAIYRRYIFFTCAQKLNQTFDDFVTEIKSKAEDCEFENIKDSLIRDRIVLGCRDTTLREKYLQNPDLTLSLAINQGQAAEASQKQLRNIEKDSIDAIRKNFNEKYKPTTSLKNSYTSNPVRANFNKLIRCSKCNMAHDFGKCPAYGKECYKCRQPNHFSNCCKNRAVRLNHGRPSVKETVEGTNLHIQGHPVDVKLDTGADVNILSERLIKEWPNMSLLETADCKIYTYTGQQIPVVGKCQLDCKTKYACRKVTFLIVNNSAVPILGLDECVNLNLVKRVETISEISVTLTGLLDEYKDVFKGNGHLSYMYDIKISDKAEPKISPARRLPRALLQPVKEELFKMEEDGIIEKIEEPTVWAHPMVVVKKPSGKYRICIDPRELNKWVLREHYTLPAPENILAEIPKAKFYSVLDAKSAFWQVPLSENTSKYLVMSTPFGRYRFLRLPFGISSAPEIFQKIMHEMFCDIPNVVCYIDDLLIWARESRLKLTLNKLQMATGVVKFLGHTISQEGILPDQDKVRAIQNMQIPKNKQELQRILGTVTYLAKFIPDLSSNTSNMRNLLKKDIIWNWNIAADQELNFIKTLLTSPPVLRHFDPNEPLELFADASKDGLGAILMQKEKPLSYASASLTSPQKHYSQIEKELLALYFGCKRFHYFLYGRTFTAYTDLKPLVSLLKKNFDQMSPRLQRLSLYLLNYQFELKFIPGKSMIPADTLSRHFLPQEQMEDKELDLCTQTFVLNVEIKDQRLTRLQDDTLNDKECCLLKQYILTGWPLHKKNLPSNLKPYWEFKEELHEWQNLICRGNKLLIPKTQRSDILKILHASHQGINNTIALVKRSIYWPGMNKEIEELINNCSICQQTSRANLKEPMLPHQAPDYPWRKSNGMVERTVQTLKKLIKRCGEESTDPYLALLNLRNTPHNNLPSPAQILMSRNLRSIIPSKTSQFVPSMINNEAIQKQLVDNQVKMKNYYDRHTRPADPLSIKDRVWFQKDKRWIPGQITNQAHEPRSFYVKDQDGNEYRRNSIHIREDKRNETTHTDWEKPLELSQEQANLQDLEESTSQHSTQPTSSGQLSSPGSPKNVTTTGPPENWTNGSPKNLITTRSDFTTATVKRRLLAEAERRSSNLPKDVGAMVVNTSSKPIETEKQFKAKVVCFKCGGKGHYARECRKKGKNEQRPKRFDQNKGVNMSAMCNTLFGATAETWIIDSGATHHMTPKRDYFTFLKEGTSNMSSITVANGSSIEACGIGTVSANIVGHKGDASNFVAQNTLYVPDMRHSVLSVLQMIENGRKVVFNKSGCHIMDMKAKMAKNQSVRGLDCSLAKPEKCENCLIGKSYQSEKQTSRKLKRIRTDNGLEFCSKEWDTFCTSIGIVHEHTMTYTPQQNGVAERMNRTLLDLVRSTISGSGLPKASWAELTYTAAYVRNRVLNNHNGESTPYELWTGNKPSLKHIRGIGCQVFVHIPRQVRKSKLERRAVKGNLVEYALRGRGYRVWIPEMKKVMESRDCVFKESDVSRNDSNREDSHNEDTVKPSPTRSHPMILRNQRNAQNSIELLSTEVNKGDPTSYKEAIQGPEAEHWLEAIEEELESLRKHKVWELTELPKDCPNCLYKARLVAKGFTQQKGIDYDEIYSPVSSFETTRLLTAIGVENNWFIYQYDVKGAYLYGKFDRVIYIEKPEGFVKPGEEHLYCQLKRSLYGLKQSGRCWNKCLDEWLKKKGFMRNPVDPCVYKLKLNEGMIILSLYVDDILTLTENQEVREKCIELLRGHFETKYIRPVSYLLGVNFTRSKGGCITLTQRAYIKSLLERFNLQEGREVSTPMETRPELLEEEDEENCQDLPYRELIGGLLYISQRTRPDIAYAVSQLARYCSKYTRKHWVAAKRILRYLKSSEHLDITYRRTGEQLCVYSDADWGTNLEDRKSRSGYVVMFAGAPILWRSSKQTVTALSTMEAEYISLSSSVREVTWIREFLNHLDIPHNMVEPTLVWCDNQAAIAHAKSYISRSKTRHIAIRYHFVREKVDDGVIQLEYVTSGRNLADILTKPLGRNLHELHRSRLLSGEVIHE
ncbi:K02A2.6-like [Cordylochernes scorpioides]|uniref:RNA-directed DNA polymerase n=1 Tax=Cordylochernes scorpioides TaxID=51811 RepID=A0ABY6JUN0_9ARAC|nr:K02A2.6-like [Cordylochernes scorpioides]